MAREIKVGDKVKVLSSYYGDLFDVGGIYPVVEVGTTPDGSTCYVGLLDNYGCGDTPGDLTQGWGFLLSEVELVE